jgi:hypothetical protein
VTLTNCPYCDRPLASDICPFHGFVGKKPDPDLSGLIPVGGIILWSGATTAVPPGWALCDGTLGTPDLRDRFIIGAGSTYAVASTGGSNAVHSHSVALTSTSDGALSSSTDVTGLSASYFADGLTGAMRSVDPGHYHNTNITVSGSGTSGTAASLPAYLALAYIMKV